MHDCGQRLGTQGSRPNSLSKAATLTKQALANSNMICVDEAQQLATTGFSAEHGAGVRSLA